MRRSFSRRRRWPAKTFVILLLAAAAAAAVWVFLPYRPRPSLKMIPIAYSALPGWQAGDPAPALAAFRRSCTTLARLSPDEPMGGAEYAGRVRDWLAVCAGPQNSKAGAAAARAWFEKSFAPFRLREGANGQALFTGYYEPEVSASRTAEGPFRTPVYGLPRDLVTIALAQFRPDLPNLRLVGELAGQRVVPFPERAAIDARGLGDAPVLLYAADPVTVFFLQIQGSGRARFQDGTMLRLAYAGQNGRPYTPIGRTLIGMGALDRQQMSMQAIRGWLEAHPGRAREVMESDKSFVFFRELPIGDPALGSPGSEGVPLAPEASLAVDPTVHPLGVPMYVAARAPAADAGKPDRPFDRLLIAQDTGGAIRGALRADIFWGFGPGAEAIAGRMKSDGALYVLLPKTLAERLPQQLLAER